MVKIKFNKRTYKNPKEFFSDVLFLIKNRKRIKHALRSSGISPAFREKIMLAVTGENNCKYCAAGHSKWALEQGISKKEIQELLRGEFGSCPAEQTTAILYARHWAETNCRPDAEMKVKLSHEYGEEKAEAINMILRVIRVGNLGGNGWDLFLYRISFGKWGR